MIKQIIFISEVLAAFGMLIYSLRRLYLFLKLTQPFKLGSLIDRIIETIKVAILQEKILRSPIIGILHSFVFWGFCVILFGSIEMMVDGFTGKEHSLRFLGIVYRFFIMTGDVFAYIILLAIVVFLFRRIFLHIKRFTGIEMKHKSHVDANIALTLILLLMVTLIGMNISASIISTEDASMYYPVSSGVAHFFTNADLNASALCFSANWWLHISLIFIFMNVLPYSKHFHVFMSVPNVLLSRTYPLGKLPNMDSITKEIKSMLNPELAQNSSNETMAEIARFGVKDVEDVTWKNYIDSLSCTQCGRCTASCPANLTGKKLSPRKIMIDIRNRMNEKGPGMIKQGKTFSDNKSLLYDYISPEELWACTTCNACAKECPVNINHPEMIVFMRRYLVMEEAAAPGMLNTMFTNIENNGAPWQFSAQDRLLWTKDLINY
jgi:heterodisulfide reductase subunit C/nitrate reductase gamma subunit